MMAGKLFNPRFLMIKRRNMSTVDLKEIEHFRKMKDEWWNVKGPLMLLHSMNKIRVPIIRDRLLASNLAKTKLLSQDPEVSLRGFKILDAGCGGGILTEPLAAIGSDIVGLDANPDLIEQAKHHSSRSNCQYVCATIEEYAEEFENHYDAVVASETIEHITEKEVFIKAAIKCLKPGGLLFMSTNSKTWMSDFVNIYLAENVLKIIPKDTHEFDKFISRHDLEKIVTGENCKTEFWRGMFYNPITNKWTLSKNFDFLWYIIQAVKLEK